MRSMRRVARDALAARSPTTFPSVVTCVSVVRVLLASTWTHPLPLADGITQINDSVSPSLCKDCNKADGCQRRTFALVERRGAQTSAIPIQRQMRHKSAAENDSVSTQLAPFCARQHDLSGLVATAALSAPIVEHCDSISQSRWSARSRPMRVDVGAGRNCRSSLSMH